MQHAKSRLGVFSFEHGAACLFQDIDRHHAHEHLVLSHEHNRGVLSGCGGRGHGTTQSIKAIRSWGRAPISRTAVGWVARKEERPEGALRGLGPMHKGNTGRTS